MTTGSRQVPPADGGVMEGEIDSFAVGETVGCPPVAVVVPEQLASITTSAQIPRNFTVREPCPPPVSYGVLPRKRGRERSGEERIDGRVAAAGDVVGILFPIPRIEGLEAPGSGVAPGSEGGDQGLELDDPFAR